MMFRKLLFLILALGFCLTSLGRAANETITWVSDSNDDSGFTDLLTAEGYIVDRHNEDLQGPLARAELNLLNAARLVIVSRSTGFMSESNVSDTTDTSQYLQPDDWNGITAPLLLMSTHLAKPTAWKWFPSSDDANTDRTLIVEDPNHPVFDGFTVSEGDAIDFLDDTPRRTTMALRPSANEGSNGQLIATRDQQDRIWIVFWEEGLEFYKGSGQFAGGPRLFLSSGTGYRAQDGPPGSYNLAGDGNKVYLNAVRYMISLGRDPVLAFNESPEDGATDVNRNVILNWTPGDFTATNNVYFGISSEDVNNASVSDPRGVLLSQGLNANTFDPGRVDFGETYFWRIDGVNDLEPGSPLKGEVWSFIVEPFAYPLAGENITATASTSNNINDGPENTINGSGLDADDLHSDEEADMWLSGTEPLGAWIEYQFDKIYKLREMWVWNYNTSVEPVIGFGIKDATIAYSADGNDWTVLSGVPEFARGTGAAGYTTNTTVDISGVVGKYVKITANSNWGGLVPQFGLSEVRFLYMPVWPREPDPASGATDIDVDNVTLSWRAGREAASHEVFLSDSNQAVIDGTAPVVSVSEASYDTGELDLAQSYYWKVNEVNMAETPATWESDVWNFTTRKFLVVDDFESYNDLDPGDPESKRIFNVWIDGYEVPTNGSLVGYESAPFCERTIVHSGKQSMPLAYSNTGGAAYSEAELPLSPPQNWTQAGAATLVLYFHGTGGNTGQLYVKINGTKVVYAGDAVDLTQPRWKQWAIDLASVGANLQAVTTLSIGVEGGGAEGVLYVDDIQLFKVAPATAKEQIWLEAESADSFTNPLRVFSDRSDASGGQYLGTVNEGGPNGDQTTGVAVYTFTVQGGTYRMEGRASSPPSNSNSFWIRLDGEGEWLFWEFTAHDDFLWHTISEYTLESGTHTLEVAYREDGARLDTIVITDKLD